MIKQRKQIQEQMQNGSHAAAFHGMRNVLSSTNDFLHLSQYLKLLRSIDRSEVKFVPLRVAVVGNSTLEHLVQALEARLLLEGFEPSIYFSKFGTLTQTVLDTASDLYSFRPDIIWIFTTYRDTLLEEQVLLEQEGHSQARIDDAVSRMRALWDAIQANSSAMIIQNNSDFPHFNSLGNVAGTAQWGPSNLIRRYNSALVSVTTPRVILFDIEAISRWCGTQLWADNRLWHHSKHAITLDASAIVARRVSRVIAAIKGLSKKCIVLDLDNTLWGGIIGDDGIDGIQLGSTPEGEAFVEFHKYLKSLKDRGIILAVCSKNQEDTAKEVFAQHPEMQLKLEDISIFIANWQHKPGNIREIATHLNIGLDSLVFIDDNPVERDLVRQQLPMVCVPELPADPAEYIAAVEAHGYFEALSIIEEDITRVKMYSENAMRMDLQQQHSNINEYLKDLQMECVVGSVDSFHLPRMAQLMQKSNQFNLTNLRYMAADFEAAKEDKSTHIRYFKLKDRFGDNGLISVIILKQVGESLEILSWVMSCRVLSRGVEEFIMNEVCRIASSISAGRILGKYVKSKKNQMVENLYSRLGFSCIGQTEETSSWERAVPHEDDCFHTFISAIRELPQEKSNAAK